MEDDKRGDRNLAKAEAARRLARLQRGSFWIGTEKHPHATVATTIWSSYTPGVRASRLLLTSHWRSNASGPGEKLPSVEEVASRLSQQWPVPLVEAAIWKVVADSCGSGASVGRSRAVHA